MRGSVPRAGVNPTITHPLYRKIQGEGWTVTEAAAMIGVPRPTLSNFLHRRYSYVSKAYRRMIRQWMIDRGYRKAPVKRVPVCQRCGLTYPTKRLAE